MEESKEKISVKLKEKHFLSESCVYLVKRKAFSTLTSAGATLLSVARKIYKEKKKKNEGYLLQET